MQRIVCRGSLPLIAVFFFVGASAEAEIVPELTVEVGLVASPMNLNPTGIDNGDGTFTYTGSMDTDNWEFDWNMTVDPDPFVDALFAIKNVSGVTQTFVVSVTMPIAPPVLPSSLMGGSAALTVTDANFTDGATLSTQAGTPFYSGEIDGVGVLSLFDDPYTLSAAFGSNSDSMSAGLPGPTIPGPAALNSIGIRHVFTLTPGDSASLTSSFIVVAVPEPQSWLLMLVAIGGVGWMFALRRRRAV